MRDARSRRGIALVVVSALLALLALVVVGISATAGAGRRVAGGQILSARAALLAHSGVERATQAVARHPVPRGGGDPALDWTFRDPVGTRLEAASNPSLHDPQMEPWLDDGDGIWEGEGYTDRNGNGRYDAASGRLRGALWERGDTYTLRIEDESAKINVNGGFLDDEDRDGDDIPDHRDPDVRENPADPKDTGRGWNFQLARILDVLGTAGEDSNGNGILEWQLSEDLNGNGLLDPPPIGVPGFGAAVVERRPKGGYGSVEDVRRVVSGAVGIPLPDLSPYLTVSSWIDHSVIHPNAVRPDGNGNVGGVLPATQSDLMKTRGPLRIEEGGRPPVNLSAADGHVLFALTSGLEAAQSVEPTANGPGGLPAMFAATGGILTGRPREFTVWARQWWGSVDPSWIRTWGEFQLRWGMKMQGTIPGVGLHHRGIDLYPANFDPNTRLNKHEPDQLMWRRCDKTDLLVWSTEGSLGSTGTFRVRSLGRVGERDGSAEARADLDVTVEVFTPLRQTTQADFLTDRVPDTGDTSCLSLAPESVRTTGSAPACSWNTWAPGRGLSVVTYPAPPPALPARASDVDGAIALATTEIDHEDFESGFPLTFAHHFDDSWDADVGGARGLLDSAYVSLLQRDVGAEVWPPSPAEPGTFCPDGAHSQHGRCPAYRAAGNLPAFGGAPPGNHGTFSYWTRQMGDLYERFLGPACIFPDRIQFALSQFSDPPMQRLRVGRISSYWLWSADSWMPLGGTYLFKYDQIFAVQFHVPIPFRPPWRYYVKNEDCRWRLVTCSFDTNEADPSAQTWMTVGDHTGSPGGFRSRSVIPFDPAAARDLLAGDGQIVLGPTWEGADQPGAPLPPPSFDVHQTHMMDEVVAYDLGDDGPAAVARAAQLHERRMQDGRYYKGDDGRFLSAVLEPASGKDSRLLWTAWTAFHPSETRLEVWSREHFMTEALYIPTEWTPRTLDPALARARVEVDLMAEDGTTVLQPLVQGGQVGRSLDRFRYRVRFINGLTELGIDPLNQGVLESPWFDDITFYVQPASGSRVLSWRGP